MPDSVSVIAMLVVGCLGIRAKLEVKVEGGKSAREGGRVGPDGVITFGKIVGIVIIPKSFW